MYDPNETTDPYDTQDQADAEAYAQARALMDAGSTVTWDGAWHITPPPENES